MEKVYKNERIKNLEEITARHKFRQIEGCTSWRHFAVHEDRAWLLNAIEKIRNQAEKVRQAEADSDQHQVFEAEVHKLLGMLEETTLKHLGDEEK